MKKTRVIAIAALVAVCIAGWAILSMTAVSDAQAQKNTIATAQYYRDKKLFQLSLQNYQAALSSKTTEELYDEYLAACDAYYEDSPTATVRSTEESAYAAAVSVYPARADYWTKYASLYYEDGDYSKLIEVLKSASANGIAFDETLQGYWNEAYYACNVSGVSYETMVPSGMAGAYLAWDGEKNVLFSLTSGELMGDGFTFISPVGQNNVVLATGDKGESYVYRLNDGVMVGRFMAEVEQANGYGGGLIPVQFKGRSDWSYIDLDGKEYLNGYQAAGMFQNGKAPVQLTDGSWCFVDQSGTQQGDSYEEIQLSENGSWLVNGVYLAKKNGVWNVYSEAREQQGALNADAVDLNRGSGIAFEKSGKWGYALADGSVAIEPQYDGAKAFSGGVAAVCKDGKWGFINGSGTLVIDYLLDDATYFDANGYCPVKTEDSDALQVLSWRVERS